MSKLLVGKFHYFLMLTFLIDTLMVNFDTLLVDNTLLVNFCYIIG